MHADEVTDGRAQLSRGGEAGPFRGVPAELGEPDFYLVEPRGVSGCVVELHVLVPLQPLETIWNIATKTPKPWSGQPPQK